MIAGVASKSQETSLRLFNGRSRYDQWVFLPQPRLLGGDKGPLPPAAPDPSPFGGSRSTLAEAHPAELRSLAGRLGVRLP